MTTTEIISTACAISGPATAGIWYLVSASQKEATRKLIRDEFTNLIDVALNKFKTQLNGPAGYRRSESCDLMMKPVEETINRIGEDLHELRTEIRLTKAAGSGD